MQPHLAALLGEGPLDVGVSFPGLSFLSMENAGRMSICVQTWGGRPDNGHAVSRCGGGLHPGLRLTL